MINPHELRVGNYISHKVPSVKGGVRIFRIRGIITNEYGRAMVYTYLDNPPKSNEYMASDYVENFEPIELTPDLFEKAGFSNQKYEEWEAFAYKDTPICAFLDGVEWCFKHGYDADLVFASCEFLHQLQNLIFDLTKHELEISFD